MKTGINLQEMAAELQRQQDAKRDFIASTSAMEFGVTETAVVTGVDEETGNNVVEMQPNVELRVRGVDETLECGKTSHAQFAGRTGIPKKYYDKMLLEAPELLVRNLNEWLHRGPTDQLVRTLDGKCRALLSSRYRPMDNFDLATAVLPAFTQHEAHVESINIDEDSFHLKAIMPGLKAEIAPASLAEWKWGEGHHPIDVVQGGIVIRNSEVGAAALSISPAVHTVQCTNLATFKEDAMRKTHVGRRNAAADEGFARFLTDETHKLNDAALWSSVRDLTVAALDGRVFHARVEELKRARSSTPIENVEKTIEAVAVTFGLNEDESSNVLSHLASGGELNQYGLSAALTRASQDLDSYDRASEFERLGGQVIELKQSDWKTLATAS